MLGRITEHAGDVLWAQLKLMYLLNDLQSQQMTDLTAAIAAQNRADAFEAARRTSAEAQGRENLSRFLDYGTGYTPTAVSMFR